jgi:xanthine dehydrogenase small subunit
VTIKAYFLPESLEEAVLLLKEHGSELVVSGGGTLTMMLINNGHMFPDAVMGLRRAGIDGIKINGNLQIGAMATMTQILNMDVSDLLKQAARQVGGWSLRNMATVGGNLMMPPPAGDFGTALLALDAEVQLVSADSERIVSLADFYASSSRTKDGELIAEVRVGKPRGKTIFLKYARRQANAPAVVSVAAHVILDGEKVTQARLALNGVAPAPMRAIAAENLLIGNALEPDVIVQAAQAAAETCKAWTDAIASEWYRRKMVSVFVRRALVSLA